jgi:hypothetical protein
VESGIVGKYGLSGFDDCPAAFSDAFVLDVFISRSFYKIDIFQHKDTKNTKERKKS